MSENKKNYNELLKKIKTIFLLENITEVLYWDLETTMPNLERDARGMQIELLSKTAHKEITSKEVQELIQKIEPEKLSKDELCNYKDIKRLHERAIKIPESLIIKIESAKIKANNSWKRARERKDFKIFEKDLNEIVKLNKEYAKKINPKQKPYTVLFEEYEEDIPYDDAKKLIYETYNELKDLIKQAPLNTKKKRTKKIDENAQREFCEKLLQDIGYDFNKGVFAISTHPFTGNPSFGRITTRYTDGWLFTILSTMHEGGHALYEQGLPLKHYATPRGASKNMSIHESQSRLWENHIGRSERFWRKRYNEMKNKFKLDDDKKEFLEKLNKTKKDYIRVNADELTYIAHILIRLEIEEKLIDGNLKVKDAKREWNKLYKKYLDITPRNDSEGILQDVHWSTGSFGYFPTYALGSIIAAQIYHHANKELKIEEKGNYKELLKWLREKIHKHGRKYSAQELIKKATRENITNKYYIEHLKKRYN